MALKDGAWMDGVGDPAWLETMEPPQQHGPRNHRTGPCGLEGWSLDEVERLKLSKIYF